MPGDFHGPKSLTGCSPWGHKDSDMTEQHTQTQRWGGIGGQRETQEGGNMCILKDNSHCCNSTNQYDIVKNYSPVKNKLNQKRDTDRTLIDFIVKSHSILKKWKYLKIILIFNVNTIYRFMQNF